MKTGSYRELYLICLEISQTSDEFHGDETVACRCGVLPAAWLHPSFACQCSRLLPFLSTPPTWLRNSRRPLVVGLTAQTVLAMRRLRTVPPVHKEGTQEASAMRRSGTVSPILTTHLYTAGSKTKETTKIKHLWDKGKGAKRAIPERQGSTPTEK